jgi:queuine tRNA-ribosyltransferase
VGEPKELTASTLAATTVLLPADKPRYLMGVGAPEDLVRYVGLGVDLFDCVLPTRLGRNGTVFRGAARLSLSRADVRQSDGPVDPWCRCAVCANHSIAYLAHLHREREPLGARLASYHNVSSLVQLAHEARAAIQESAFTEWQRDWLTRNQVARIEPN